MCHTYYMAVGIYMNNNIINSINKGVCLDTEYKPGVFIEYAVNIKRYIT